MPATDDVTAPEKLTAEQDVSAFKSGEPTLDDWLKRRALADEESGAFRTYMNSGGPCERHPERFVGLGRQRHAQQVHCGTTLASAGLAVAERIGASGRDLLCAMVVLIGTNSWARVHGSQRVLHGCECGASCRPRLYRQPGHAGKCRRVLCDLWGRPERRRRDPDEGYQGMGYH